MPRPLLADAESSFVGGLNTAADDSLLGETELRRADNGRLTVFGAVTKRGGTQRTHVTALPGAVRGGSEWAPDGGNVTQLAVANGTLYTGAYAIPMTWTAQTGALNATSYPTFAAFRDASKEVCYVADGVLRKWDGTTLTTAIAGTPAIVSQIAVQNRRLFGINGVDESLYYSAIDNGDTLGNAGSGGGQEIIRTFSKRKNVALLALADSLLIFHSSGISTFTGWSQDDIAINSGTRGVSADTGTLAPHSLVAVENAGFFLTDRGFYQVTTAGVQPISAKIESVIRDLDQSQFFRVQGVHNKANSEVAWYLPDVGRYIYNYRLGAWTGPDTGIFSAQPVGAMWATTDATTRPIVLTGHADGFVRRVEPAGIYQDDVKPDGSGGMPVVLNAQARRFYCQTPEIEKAWRWLYVQGTSGGSSQATLNWTTETASGTYTLPHTADNTWGSFNWGAFTWGVGGSGSQRAPLCGRGKYIDVSFVDGGITGIPSVSRLKVEGFGYGSRY